MQLIKQGAEACVYQINYLNQLAALKHRLKKSYRHPQLDQRLTQQRIKDEARCMTRAMRFGIRVPCLYALDMDQGVLLMEWIEEATTLRDFLAKLEQDLDIQKELDEINPLMRGLAYALAGILVKLHGADLVHGDLTTSNILVQNKQESTDSNLNGNENFEQCFQLVMIDFGLSGNSTLLEDKAVDLYVLERTFQSTHPKLMKLWNQSLQFYREIGKKHGPAVLNRLDEVRLRGRKRSMIG